LEVSAVVITVNVCVPVGVTDAGDKEQVGLVDEDNPATEQVGDRAVFQPSMDAYVTVCVELLPLVIKAVAGEADTEKSGSLVEQVGIVKSTRSDPVLPKASLAYR